MLFTSSSYFLFFITYFVCFYFLKPSFRLHLLIIGSIIFYSWLNPVMIWVPIVLCSMAFWGTSWIVKAEASQIRSIRFWTMITALISPLIYYKYKHFLYNEILVPVTGMTSINFSDSSATRHIIYDFYHNMLRGRCVSKKVPTQPIVFPCFCLFVVFSTLNCRANPETSRIDPSTVKEQN